MDNPPFIFGFSYQPSIFGAYLPNWVEGYWVVMKHVDFSKDNLIFTSLVRWPDDGQAKMLSDRKEAQRILDLYNAKPDSDIGLWWDSIELVWRSWYELL